jgi:hypothetical protein
MLLYRVEGFLVEDQSEAWIKPASALPSVEVDVVSGLGMGHCDASVPESAVITEFVAPVLQVMPELQELCGESSVVIPIELGSLEASAMAMMPSPPSLKPCQTSAIVNSGGVLPPNSEAHFGKELCDLLVSLEVASPGYGMEHWRTVLGTIPGHGPVSPRQKQCIWPVKFKIYIQI